MADETFTTDEVRDRINRLSSADLLRLERACRKCAEGLLRDGSEFLSDAILKALNGERKCPRDVNLVTFLYMAVRSLVDAERQRAKRQVQSQTASSESGEVLVLDALAATRNAEDLLVAREDFEERLSALDRIFQDDEEAQLVIMCEREDMRGEQIYEELSMTGKQLATVQRRIRRKIDRAYPQGWLS